MPATDPNAGTYGTRPGTVTLSPTQSGGSPATTNELSKTDITNNVTSIQAAAAVRLPPPVEQVTVQQPAVQQPAVEDLRPQSVRTVQVGDVTVTDKYPTEFEAWYVSNTPKQAPPEDFYYAWETQSATGGPMVSLKAVHPEYQYYASRQKQAFSTVQAGGQPAFESEFVLDPISGGVSTNVGSNVEGFDVQQSGSNYTLVPNDAYWAEGRQASNLSAAQKEVLGLDALNMPANAIVKGTGSGLAVAWTENPSVAVPSIDYTYLKGKTVGEAPADIQALFPNASKADVITDVSLGSGQWNFSVASWQSTKTWVPFAMEDTEALGFNAPRGRYVENSEAVQMYANIGIDVTKPVEKTTLLSPGTLVGNNIVTGSREFLNINPETGQKAIARTETYAPAPITMPAPDRVVGTAEADMRQLQLDQIGDIKPGVYDPVGSFSKGFTTQVVTDPTFIENQKIAVEIVGGSAIGAIGGGIVGIAASDLVKTGVASVAISEGFSVLQTGQLLSPVDTARSFTGGVMFAGAAGLAFKGISVLASSNIGSATVRNVAARVGGTALGQTGVITGIGAGLGYISGGPQGAMEGAAMGLGFSLAHRLLVTPIVETAKAKVGYVERMVPAEETIGANDLPVKTWVSQDTVINNKPLRIVAGTTERPMGASQLDADYVNKVIPTAHAGLDPKAFDFKEGGETLLKGFPDASKGFRKEAELFPFYSAPGSENFVTAYGGYMGIGGGESGGSKIRFGGKPFLAVTEETYVSPKYRSMSGESTNDYLRRITNLSGETGIPAENYLGYSTERQVVTPSSYMREGTMLPGSKYVSEGKVGRYQVKEYQDNILGRIPLVKDMTARYTDVDIYKGRFEGVESAKEFRMGKTELDLTKYEGQAKDGESIRRVSLSTVAIPIYSSFARSYSSQASAGVSPSTINSRTSMPTISVKSQVGQSASQSLSSALASHSASLASSYSKGYSSIGSTYSKSRGSVASISSNVHSYGSVDSMFRNISSGSKGSSVSGGNFGSSISNYSRSVEQYSKSAIDYSKTFSSGSKSFNYSGPKSSGSSGSSGGSGGSGSKHSYSYDYSYSFPSRPSKKYLRSEREEKEEKPKLRVPVRTKFDVRVNPFGGGFEFTPRAQKLGRLAKL